MVAIDLISCRRSWLVPLAMVVMLNARSGQRTDAMGSMAADHGQFR